MAVSSPRTVSIIIASVIAVVLVGGAYAASGPIPFLGKTNVADAESSAELLKSYAAKDTDGDQLPDWQEALYGTDPNNPESVQKGTKDGDAVSQGLVKPKVLTATSTQSTAWDSVKSAAPSTLTDRFAQKLLTQYLLTRGTNPPSTDDIAKFVQQGVADAELTALPSLPFTLSDVPSVSGSGPTALTAYAAQVEQIFAANTVKSPETALESVSDAVHKNDKAGLAQVKAMSKAYGNIASSLKKLSVPQEMRYAHIALVNSLIKMSDTTLAMSAINDDPLLGMLGLSEYQPAVESMVKAFSGMSTVLTTSNTYFAEGAPGYYFAQTAASMTTPQSN